MSKEKKALRILLLIATPKQADRAADLCAEARIPIQYQFPAHGTASSEIMDLLGLGNTNKSILIALANKYEADTLLHRMYDRLNLGAAGSGIAFTLPLSGCSRLLINLLETPEGNALPIKEREQTMSEYTMIVTLVDQGFSEEVMAAARTAGARGGTVISVRRNEDDTRSETWGVNLLDEKEAVIILTKNDEKNALMQAISSRCGIQSEAQGLVFSMPIDSAIGLGQNKQITSAPAAPTAPAEETPEA